MNKTTAEINRIRLEGLLERGRMLSQHLQDAMPAAAKTVTELLTAVRNHGRHMFTPSEDSNFCNLCGSYFLSDWHWRTTDEKVEFVNQNQIVFLESK